MHVLKERDGLVVLNTSVFLRDDIESILGTVTPLARELSQRVLEAGAAFKGAPPEIAMLVNGEIQNESLRSSAEAANLFRQEEPRTSVITRETVREYEDAVKAIIDVVSSYYGGELDTLNESSAKAGIGLYSTARRRSAGGSGMRALVRNRVQDRHVE